MKAILADITTLKVDAIVNAANSALAGGGGVDGAIHRAAGPMLNEACRELHGCRAGNAKITEGFNLPARWIIHTVGPIFNASQLGSHRRILARCYWRCLELAQRYQIRTIAFPCIGTGVYGFPKAEAARIAVQSVSDFKASTHYVIEVTFCCFTPEDLQIYEDLLASLK